MLARVCPGDVVVVCFVCESRPVPVGDIVGGVGGAGGRGGAGVAGVRGGCISSRLFTNRLRLWMCSCIICRARFCGVVVVIGGVTIVGGVAVELRVVSEFDVTVHILGVACCVIVWVRVMVVGICEQIQTQPFHFVVVDVICWCEKGDLSYCGWGDSCRLMWSWL